MALYFQKLDKDGVLVVHISNRHLDLSGVVGSAAAVSGMVALIQSDRRPRSEMGSFDDQSVWVAVARDRARLATLSADPRWAWLETAPDAEPWTDDYSNILGVLR